MSKPLSQHQIMLQKHDALIKATATMETAVLMLKIATDSPIAQRVAEMLVKTLTEIEAST